VHFEIREQMKEREIELIVQRVVEHYNTVRLHSAIGYVTPANKLVGRERAIFAERDYKLEAARVRRRVLRATFVSDLTHTTLQHSLTENPLPSISV